MKRFLTILILLFLFLFLVQGDLLSQCPMCRMSAEANLKDGGTAARGLNNGILYIFAMPYILVSIIGYIWWKRNKKAKLSMDAVD